MKEALKFYKITLTKKIKKIIKKNLMETKICWKFSKIFTYDRQFI